MFLFLKNKTEIYVYNFETKTDLKQNGILVPYYCIVHKFCNTCLNKKLNDLTSHSKCCRERCHKFSRNDCLQTFTTYFIQKSKLQKQMVHPQRWQIWLVILAEKISMQLQLESKMHNRRKQNYQHEIGKLSSPGQHVIFQMFFEKNKHVRNAKRRRKRFPSLQIHRHLIHREHDTKTFFRPRKHEWNRMLKNKNKFTTSNKNFSNTVQMTWMFWENAYWTLTPLSKTPQESNFLLTIE